MRACVRALNGYVSTFVDNGLTAKDTLPTPSTTLEALLRGDALDKRNSTRDEDLLEIQVSSCFYTQHQTTSGEKDEPDSLLLFFFLSLLSSAGREAFFFSSFLLALFTSTSTRSAYVNGGNHSTTILFINSTVDSTIIFTKEDT